MGMFLLVAPLIFATWAVATFRRHHTVVHPRGDVRSIVDAGPFRFTRNPMYLSLVLIHVGGLLAFHLAWAAVLFPVVFLAFHFAVILPEERYLAAKFGEPYEAYRRRVRRWI
jgi:protein-S-isoprenylcysteine O-methyltransferase Ste14